MKKYLLIVIAFLLIPSFAFADTHTAASCSYADVNTAYTAASAGDTVSVPAGTCDWGSSTLTISKAVILQGAGKTQTILTGAHTGTAFITLNTGSNAQFAARITGFKFDESSGLAMQIYGSGWGWRIDNNHFMSTAGVKRWLTLLLKGGTTDYKLFGLIDSNQLDYVKINFTAYGTSGSRGQASWQATSQFGTDQAIFIENNIFIEEAVNPTTGTTTGVLGGAALDGNGGFRAVLRYNDLYNAFIESHGACAPNSAPRGTKSYEVYGNRFYGIYPSGYSQYAPISLRAGSNVVTRNQFLGYWQSSQTGVDVDNMRSMTPTANCTGGTYGDCDGTSPYDENGANGYQCMDQIGAGTQTGTMGVDASWTLDPMYSWGNVAASICRGGANIYQSCTTDANCPGSTCAIAMTGPNKIGYKNTDDLVTTHIVGGRDFYDSVSGSNEKAGWSAYTCPHPTADPSAQGSCATDAYGTTAYTLTGGASDTTAPTCTWAIDSTGLIATGTCSESVDAVTKTGLHFDGSVTGAITATYKDGLPGTSPRFDLGSEVQQSDVVTATYATPGTGIKDAAGNALADFTDTSVFNGSTQNTPPTYSVTVNKTGTGCTITSSPSGVNCGSTCTVTVDNGTVVTLGGYSENGWEAITYGGHCAANGTVTVDGAKECTATCTQTPRLPFAVQ